MSSAGGRPSWQAMVSVRTSIVPPGPCPPLADTPDTSAVVTTPQVTASLHDFAVSLGFGRSSGVGGDGRYPCVASEGVADGGEDGDSVLGGGGCVAADGVAGAGGCLRAEPAADFLLGFGGAQVTFGLVGGRRDCGAGQEPQYV